MTNIQILKRLFNDYTKKYLPKIFLALIFSLILAASTSAIAWLLDPAIEKLFIQKNQSLMLINTIGYYCCFCLKRFIFISCKSL